MAVKRNLTDEKGKKVKISQAEIDAVKKMGMKKALAAAGKNPVTGANRSDTANFKQAKLVEAVRRLYGEQRFQNAIYKPKSSPGPIGSASNVRESRSTVKTKPKPSANNLREGRVSAPKSAVKPKTPYQKDMARRGIYL